MYPSNSSRSYNSIYVTELSIQSRDVVELCQKVNNSIVDKYSTFDSQWRLVKAYNIDNKIFNKEFNEKRAELQHNSLISAHKEVQYGFLATIKESMIYKVAEEGLEIRLCPYNYFGHGISGIHISQNADVCMKEARSKLGPDEQIILITFKYMLGKHKIVPMYDPDILLAPTPNYDSHLCEERPDPNENIYSQYIKSLVYLYEFENDQMDPVIRPRQCCPVSALVFNQARARNVVDLTDSDATTSRVSMYDNNSISFLKPIQQSHWGREFLLKGPTEIDRTSMSFDRNERNDLKSSTMVMYNKSISKKPLLERLDKRDEYFEDINSKYDARSTRDINNSTISMYTNSISKKPLLDRVDQRDEYLLNRNPMYDVRSTQDMNNSTMSMYQSSIAKKPLLERLDKNDEFLDDRNSIYDVRSPEDVRHLLNPYNNEINRNPSTGLINHYDEYRDYVRPQYTDSSIQGDRNRSERSRSRSKKDIIEINDNPPNYFERERSFDRLKQCREMAKARELPRQQTENLSKSSGFDSKNHMSALRNWFR